MTFHWPQLFWLLLIPVTLSVLELRRRRAYAHRLTHPKILRAEAGTHDLELRTVAQSEITAGTAPSFRWKLHLGLALLIVSLARPQWGQLDEPVFDQAREIVIALDLSRSMLAPDVRPSRLERAKLLVASLLERLAGERVGLVVFAGTAFLQSPLSSDYEILNEFLPSLTPDYLPQGGSNYRALTETALSAFGESGSADRFLIVLSDGEATDDTWRSAAEQLKEKNIRVIGLGIGTAEGAILPDGSGGYVKDERGAVVMSKLEPATLQQLATMTNGVYSDASSWIDLAQLIQSTVETGRKGEFKEERHARQIERFQWALAPALLFLLWSFYRDFPVRPRTREIKLRRPASTAPLPKTTAVEAASVVLLIALFTAGSPRAQAVENSAAEPLSKLVGQFAQRDILTARDYAELARTTLTYGQREKSAQQPVVEGAIRDGLAAVDAGQALDAKAADWANLRSELEKLLEKENQQQQQQQQQDKNDKQQDEQKDQKKDQQQKDSKQQQESDQQKEESDQQQKSNSQEKSSDQNQKSENEKSPKDSNEKNPSDAPDQKDKTPPSQPQSAFGDMDKKPKEEQKPQNPASSETQKVGGAPEQKKDMTPPDPAMVVPLQRLEQLRNQDSPVRLQQLMRGNQTTPPTTGKNW